MSTKLNNLAKRIIKENEYLSLATVDSSGKPWICILAYSFDANYNFYYISLPTSKHSMHIKINSCVSFSIFDSRQLFGNGVGLQIEGVAKEVDDKEFSYVERIYFSRKYPYGNIKNEFMQGLRNLLKNKTYLFYKIAPTAFWINDPDADTDQRVEIKFFPI